MTGPSCCLLPWIEAYVVERGLTTMTVAGTGLVVGAASAQPGSRPPWATGVQAGRLGAICCVSAFAGLEVTSGTLM